MNAYSAETLRMLRAATERVARATELLEAALDRYVARTRAGQPTA